MNNNDYISTEIHDDSINDKDEGMFWGDDEFKLVVEAIDLAIDALTAQLSNLDYKGLKMVSVCRNIPIEVQQEMEIEDKIDKLIELKTDINNLLDEEFDE